MVKQNNAEVMKRVEAVLQIRLAGAGIQEIRHYAAENGWNVSERQLWRYVAASDKILASQLEPTRKKRLALHFAQRRLLYNRAVETGDYRTALAVLGDTADLQGLYPPKKVEQQHTGKGGGPLRLTIEDLVKADQELEDFERGKRGEAGGDSGDPAEATAGNPQVP